MKINTMLKKCKKDDKEGVYEDDRRKTISLSPLAMERESVLDRYYMTS